MSYTRNHEGRPQTGHDPIMPRFYMDAVEDPAASAQAGFSVYREVERVQLIIPGGLNQPVLNVTDEHRARWKEQYKAFKEGVEQSIEGIPIEQWPALNKAQVMTFKAQGLHTVEQCSALSDNHLRVLGLGGRKLRELAKGYLDDAYAQAELNKALADAEKKDARIAELENSVAELRTLVDQLHRASMANADRTPAIHATAPFELDPIARAQPVFAQASGEPSPVDMVPEARRRPGRPTNAEREARMAAEAS